MLLSAPVVREEIFAPRMVAVLCALAENRNIGAKPVEDVKALTASADLEAKAVEELVSVSIIR